MATNFIQNGEVMTVTAAANHSSGDGVVQGVMFGVATTDVTSGDEVEIALTGVWDLPKLEAQAWTVGAAIYWDPTPGECTTATAAGNLLIGVAAAVAANPTTTGSVRLNGAFPAAVTV